MARKHEVELEIHRVTNVIRVIKDAGFDVAIVTPSEGKLEILNPREQVLLERDAEGRIKLRSLPNDRTKVKMTPVEDATATPATPPETEEPEPDA